MNKIILTLAAVVLIFVENSQQEKRGGRFFDLNNPDYKSIYPWPKESSIGTKEESPKTVLKEHEKHLEKRSLTKIKEKLAEKLKAKIAKKVQAKIAAKGIPIPPKLQDKIFAKIGGHKVAKGGPKKRSVNCGFLICRD